MRPRWRSRGDGLACCIQRTTAPAEDGGSRACCFARNDRLRSGEEGRRSRCRPRPDRRQTSRDERPYRGFAALSAENDVDGRCLLISMSSAVPASSPLPMSLPSCFEPTTPIPLDMVRAISSRLPVEPSVSRGAPKPPQICNRSDHAGFSNSESSDAIKASGALNRPRRSSGGTTASTASSFSVGSMRR